MLLWAAVALHCGPHGAEPAAPQLLLALSPSGPQIARDTAQQFTVRGLYAGGHTRELTQAVTWTVSAADGSPRPWQVSADGLLSLQEPGRYRVSAEYGGHTAATQITVTTATLKTLSISPTAPQVAKGLTQAFTATAGFSDGTTQDVTRSATWSVKDVVGTSVVLLSSTGVATARNLGKAQITARYKTLSVSTTMQVTAATIKSLALSPSGPSIAKGTTQSFKATGTFSDGTVKDLTPAADWAVTDVIGSGVAAIDGAGNAVGEAVGQAMVSATYMGQVAQTTLTVTAAVPVSLALSPGAAAIAKGTTQSFAAIATLSDGSSQDVSAMGAWTASDVMGVGVASVASSGVATGNDIGQALIACAVGDLSASATLTVTPAVLTALAVTPAGVAIAKGTGWSFSAVGTYSDGSTQDLTALAMWTTKDLVGADVLAVTFPGTVLGKNMGKATLTASYAGQTGSTTVTVTAAALSELNDLSPLEPSIKKGAAQQFVATGTFTDGSVQDLTKLVSWTATDIAPRSGVAMLSATGLATGTREGNATITASYMGQVVATTLHVIPKLALRSLAISPLDPVIKQGATKQFSATATFSDGSTQDLSDLVSWTATDVAPSFSVATLGLTGLASATQAGQATIAASYLGLSASTSLFVLTTSCSTDGWCTTPTTLGSTFRAVWGSDARNVWAVGSEGTIVKWSGAAWTLQPSGTTADLYGVWGTDANNVWAVGSGGTILTWDGTTWTTQASGSTEFFTGVWGTDANNVWVVGSNGTIGSRKFVSTVGWGVVDGVLERRIGHLATP